MKKKPRSAKEDASPDPSPKTLDQYHSVPFEQLDFWPMLHPRHERYSNTIELYDFTPKYHWGKAARVNGEFLRAIEREFECRGQRYKLVINPAKIKDKSGQRRDYYPGQREELVEDALRKMASEGKGVLLDDLASVTFTLYQLQQELKRMGHSYNIDQLKEALFICNRANIEIASEDGNVTLSAPLFETVGVSTREDWKHTGRKARCFVRFNILVTRSLKARAFRQVNYEKMMSYGSVIARQLHKRLSHHYIQASLMHTYDILLSTLIRDFGLTAYERISHNLRDVVKALEEMQEKGVLLSFAVEKIRDPAARRKLTDAKITLHTDPRFNQEIVEANRRYIGK